MLDKQRAATDIPPAQHSDKSSENITGAALGDVSEKLSQSFSSLMSPAKRKEAAATSISRNENNINSNNAPKKLESKGRPVSSQGAVNKRASKLAGGSNDEFNNESQSLLARMGRKPSAKSSTG
jgi:hypothetical protein